MQYHNCLSAKIWISTQDMPQLSFKNLFELYATVGDIYTFSHDHQSFTMKHQKKGQNNQLESRLYQQQLDILTGIQNHSLSGSAQVGTDPE